jgi:hypothetical protein
MKPKQLSRKLSLNKTTIYNLNDEQMNQVEGGASLLCSAATNCLTICGSCSICDTCVSVHTGCYPKCTVPACPN